MSVIRFPTLLSVVSPYTWMGRQSHRKVKEWRREVKKEEYEHMEKYVFGETIRSKLQVKRFLIK